ncbi:MAG: BtpA/SgcQ family protein [Planctomycetes bacterium]|nr:BtpA/SgcQ family protein [Planctomycetota bacterium]
MDIRQQTMSSIFAARRALIGMLHVGPSPGSPGSHGPQAGIDGQIARAVAEAEAYRAAGFHGLILENMFDRPYLRARVGPEVVAALAVIGREVRRAVPLPLGVQVLAAANREAIGVALACGASFVRVEGYVFAHVADEGFVEADAGALLRYRAAVGADHVRVFADVKKKHSSHALTADVDVVETAQAAEFALAEGVIVTGTATGRPADPAEVAAVSGAVGIPVFVGSGITPDNVAAFATADGLIVGSAVKQRGDWRMPLDPDAVRRIAEVFHATAGAGR